MFSIYLAGYINDKKLKECSGWRKQIVDYYRAKSYPIVWLDPLNGKNFGRIHTDGLSAQGLTPRAIFDGDMLSLSKSDLIIANLDKFGEERDMTGTISEMAIAHYHFRTPIVTITTEAQYKHHPFIIAFTSEFCDSVEQLLETKRINYYYKRTVNCQYEKEVSHALS